MGYFINGFVFTAEPAWAAAADALPDSIALRAYRHRTEPVWLLDAWPHSSYEHCPFTDMFPETLDLSPALPQETNDLLRTYSKVCSALKSESPYGAGWLRSSAQLSLATSTPCFFFAADDDLFDMACNASNGGLSSFRVRFEGCSVEYTSGKLTVVPFESEEEDDKLMISPKTIEALSRIPGVTIAPVSHEVEDHSQLCGSALQLWPIGNAESLLGIGSWDPFQHLGRDFNVVFEHIPSVAPPPRNVIHERFLNAITHNEQLCRDEPALPSKDPKLRGWLERARECCYPDVAERAWKLLESNSAAEVLRSQKDYIDTGEEALRRRSAGEASFGEVFAQQFACHSGWVLIPTLAVAALVAGYFVVQGGVAESRFLWIFFGTALCIHAIRALVFTFWRRIRG
jgi:hypothetical protein